jgi:precorrin-6B methylase 2
MGEIIIMIFFTIKLFFRKHSPDKINKFLIKTLFFLNNIEKRKKKKIISNYLTLYKKNYGFVVSAGLFKNLKYIQKAIGSEFLVKLIGCYEEEVQIEIEKLLKINNYNKLIDIGCAEGFYLVGIGHLFPKIDLVGYDIEEEALKLTKELYAKNKLKNKLKLEKKCTHMKLNKEINTDSLIICDCEGFEDYILNTNKVNFKNSDLVVEIHKFENKNFINEIIKRFEKTHKYKIIKSDFFNRNINKYSFLKKLVLKKDMTILTDEERYISQKWLILTRKNK